MSATHREKIRLNNVHAFYGESHILHGIDLTINQGELVTLLGRNGSGRSTTLKTIMNLVGKRSGQIAINGTDAMSLAPHKIAHLGVGFCPEERGIFASLNVEENLMLPPVVRSGGMSLDVIGRTSAAQYARNIMMVRLLLRLARSAWHRLKGLSKSMNLYTR